MKRIEKFLQSHAGHILLFLLCWIGLIVFYFPAHGAMLIDDGVSGIYEIQTKGFKGYLDSYGFDSFYYGHYAFVALVYLLFGCNTFGWFLVFTALHALNTVLIFKTFNSLYTQLGNANANCWMALSGAMLFLFSSYQSENIVWAATSHYAICLSILLLSIQFVLDSCSLKKTSFPLWVFHLLFAFALLTLEISFIYPFVYGLLFVLLLVYQRNQLPLFSFFLKIILPQCLLIGIYLMCYKFRHGSWIPHDRAPLEAVVGIGDMVTTFSQHLLKLFGFVHYLDFPKRDFVYKLCLHWKKVGMVLGVCAIALSYFFYLKGNKKIVLYWFFLLCGLLMFAPFLRLYFMYLARIENDRYSYFGSVVFFQLAVFVLFQFPSLVRFVVLTIYLGVFTFFNLQNIQARHMSAVMNDTFLNKYPDQHLGQIYLLNVPVSCADAYMYRSKGRIPIAYQVKFSKPLVPEPIQVAWYNAQTNHDSFEVKKIDNQTYHVQLKTNGSWWMNESMGAVEYKDSLYHFIPDEWGGYTIKFYNPLAKGDALLWFDGRQFKQAN